MFLLVFALPEEARGFRRRLRHAKSDSDGRRGLLAGREVAVRFVGIGGTTLAKLEPVILELKPRLILSSGFAGSTSSSLEPGVFVLATNYSDPELGAQLMQQNVIDAAGAFTQVAAVASVEDKWALNRSQKSIAVDMESESIAGVCRRTNTPLLTVRMISDGINENIPEIFIRRKAPRAGELGDAIRFAIRMLRLTGKLADRLESVVSVLA
jgi:adenosylhomocysteine nucleosidase